MAYVNSLMHHSIAYHMYSLCEVILASRRLQRLHILPIGVLIGVLSDSMCAAMIQGVVDVFGEKRFTWGHRVCNGQNRLFTAAFHS